MSAVTQLTHSLLLNAEPAPDDLDAVDDDDALERSTFSAITTRRHTFFSHIKAPLTTATRHVISLQKSHRRSRMAVESKLRPPLNWSIFPILTDDLASAKKTDVM